MKALLAALALCSIAAAAGAPAVQFTKSWPQSDPPYFDVRLDRSGSAEYREAPNDEPLRFRIGERQTNQIFAIVERLGFFKRPLESNLKVAKTGVKTLRYTDGAITNEVQFNYSTDPDAQALLDWFERIGATERQFLRLQRVAQYDRLGVNDALLEIEVAYDKSRLVAPEQFVPVLERIVKNPSYMHMARERAARLADAFRALETSSK